MGVVLMVARRSPKPKVGVQILSPMPTEGVNRTYENIRKKVRRLLQMGKRHRTRNTRRH